MTAYTRHHPVAAYITKFFGISFLLTFREIIKKCGLASLNGTYWEEGWREGRVNRPKITADCPSKRAVTSAAARCH
jgi:hypothetical protein